MFLLTFVTPRVNDGTSRPVVGANVPSHTPVISGTLARVTELRSAAIALILLNVGNVAAGFVYLITVPTLTPDQFFPGTVAAAPVILILLTTLNCSGNQLSRTVSATKSTEYPERELVS